MIYLLVFSSTCLIFGCLMVASNPAPYYGVVGLVIGVVGGCGLLVSGGGSFVGLVLILIYMGGMLVVFAYSIALAAEPYPESWAWESVLGAMFVYVVLVLFMGTMVSGFLGWGSFSAADVVGFDALREDVSGVMVLFSSGGGLLLVCVWGLLLTLFVVVGLVWGLGRGTLRAL